MEKRYQVFVSSTYSDLQNERSKVIQTLMEMDCIPSGMELFPAIDEDQWNFIKRIIDDCDYYILIIGGRYGSVTPDGISFTEKEYDYALEKGMRVLAFIQKPEIPLTNPDEDSKFQKRLQSFRERVAQGRLVKYWENAEDLRSELALSLPRTIRTYPAVGWVRADQVPNVSVLTELNEIRKRNQELESQLSKARPQVEGLAGLDEQITMVGEHWISGTYTTWTRALTWGELFALIAPQLLEYPSDAVVRSSLGSSLHEAVRLKGSNAFLKDGSFQTAKIQLKALGLIDLQYQQAVGGGSYLFWSLTETGMQLMFKLRTVKTTKDEQIKGTSQLTEILKQPQNSGQ